MNTKKPLSILLTICMIAGLLPWTVLPARAATESVSYLDENGETKTVTATVLNGSETELAAGWYVATDTLDYTQHITLTGNVHLILADGAALNIGTTESRVNSDDGINGYYNNGGANVSYNLAVYGQAEGSGALNVYVKKELSRKHLLLFFLRSITGRL